MKRRGGQNPHPFGCAQGRLCPCKKRRDKDGAPAAPADCAKIFCISYSYYNSGVKLLNRQTAAVSCGSVSDCWLRSGALRSPRAGQPGSRPEHAEDPRLSPHEHPSCYVIRLTQPPGITSFRSWALPSQAHPKRRQLRPATRAGSQSRRDALRWRRCQ